MEQATNGQATEHTGAAGGGAERNAGDGNRDGGVRDGVVPLADRSVAGGVTPIPSSIVQAICQIMVTVDAVKKSQRNQHGGYNFASTDDIYAAVTRKMGEVGLVMLSLEDRCEIKRVERDGKTSQWAHMEFSFVLATTADTWSDARAKRTLYIQVTGPQTFQAAQSYVEKAYLRSLLKLPTGDVDLDSMPQADDEESMVALNGGKKRKSSAEGKRDGSVKEFNRLRGEIAAAINTEMLAHVREIYAGDEGAWSGMPPAWASTLEEDYEVKMDALRAQAA